MVDALDADDLSPFGDEADTLDDEGERADRARTSDAEVRAARWDNEIDPIRGRVLYRLTVVAYQAQHGRAPRFVHLNELFPASAARSPKSAAWSNMSKGLQLPRKVAAPQALLMRTLTEVYPKAAASYSWPIWALSSSTALTLPQIHGLMLRLPDGIRHMLIGSYINGRYLRFPTDPRHEVGFMVREKSLGGISALIALMREAELKQDPLTHSDAYDAMLPHLPVLNEAFGSAELGHEFASFLRTRFATMDFIVPGAYELMPGTDAVMAPVRFRLPHRLDHETALRRHAEWLGLPVDAFEGILGARRRAQDPGAETSGPAGEQGP